MQISPITIEILKNFSTINPIFSFDGEGNTIRCKSPTGEIVAFCEIEESLPEFYIYDLKSFLQTITLVGETPNFDFGSTAVEISNPTAKKKAHYSYCAKELVDPPKKTVNFPEADLILELSKDTMVSILNAARTIGVSSICIRQNGSNVLLCAEADKGEGNNNRFSIELDTLKSPGTSDSFSFKVDSFRFIPAGYTLKISSRGIAEFATQLGNGKILRYFTPVSVK